MEQKWPPASGHTEKTVFEKTRCHQHPLIGPLETQKSAPVQPCLAGHGAAMSHRGLRETPGPSARPLSSPQSTASAVSLSTRKSDHAAPLPPTFEKAVAIRRPGTEARVLAKAQGLGTTPARVPSSPPQAMLQHHLLSCTPTAPPNRVSLDSKLAEGRNLLTPHCCSIDAS